MNSVQIHLALTHVPIILSLVGLVTLVIAWVRKSPTLTKASYVMIVISAIAALPVFFSGEGTEESVEHLPGISESMIGRHEEVANLAMIFIVSSGVVALAALFSFWSQLATRVLKALVLLLAIVCGGLMAQTAHLGGQIRHTEIRNGVTAYNEKQSAGENETTPNGGQKHDDD